MISESCGETTKFEAMTTINMENDCLQLYQDVTVNAFPELLELDSLELLWFVIAIYGPESRKIAN